MRRRFRPGEQFDDIQDESSERASKLDTISAAMVMFVDGESTDMHWGGKALELSVISEGAITQQI